ncbi:MAG: PASTA domain-containing protein [Bacteroidales bacterium]|nr:PASTA domain-containing protein [Bacteroidales bacterium]
MVSLKSCTRHGEAVTVPTVVGMDANEAIALLEEEGFGYAVVDTLLIDSLPKGVVVEQNPAKESLVKHGRTVYMKINTSNEIMVRMPSFVGEQYKTLSVRLKHSKLKMGSVKWQKDGEVVNIVLKQMYNGRPIEPGTEIKQGSRIDFVVAGRDPNSKEEDEEEEETTSTLEEMSKLDETPASDGTNFDE